MKSRSYSILLGSLIALACAPHPVFAQAAPDGANVSPAAAKEEAVVLSPFEVTSASENSYQATGTLAGTRLNSPLADVAASVSVMTADFLQDIGASNVTEALAYSVGAEPTQSGSGVGQTGNILQTTDLALSMRGFGSSTVSRNYFQVLLTASDNYNVESITFSRGPNSVLFGNGGPGGDVDAETKQAKQQPITSFTNRFGPFDDFRNELDINRPITKDLAIRVNVLDWQRKSWRDFEFLDRRSAALALRWEPSRSTTVRVELEGGLINQEQPQPWPQLDGISRWVAAGSPISTFATPNATTPVLTGTARLTATNQTFVENDGAIVSQVGELESQGPAAATLNSNAGSVTSFNNQNLVPFSSYVAGPSATTNSEFFNSAVFVEQRITSQLFVELASDYQHTNRNWKRPLIWNDMQIFADASAFLPGGAPNPYVGQYFVQSSRSAQNFFDLSQEDYRLTTSYSFKIPYFGSHQLTGLGQQQDDYTWNWNESEAWINNPAQPAYTNAANAIVRRTYLSFNTPGTLSLPRGFLNPFDNPIKSGAVQSGYYISSRVNQLNRLKTWAAVLQSKFLSDRLVTTVGVRRDGLTQYGSTNTLDPVTKAITGATRSASAATTAGNTETLGAVLHVLPWLSFGINKSSNSNPQAQLAFGLNADNLNLPLGPVKGEGIDGSARFSFFEGRVTGSVTYYETSQVNAYTPQAGNATSGWLLWLNQAYITLGKPGASFSPDYIDGNDTTDQRAAGWETEWMLNVNRNLRIVVNATPEAVNSETNLFPRFDPFGQALATQLLANPTLPVSGVAGVTTAAQLAATIQTQIATDQKANGLDALGSRRHSGNLFANYRFFGGKLNGVQLSAGINYRGNRCIGFNSVTGAPWFAGGYSQFNGSIGYAHPLQLAGKKLHWNIKLAGTNLFGRRYGLLASDGDDLGVDRYFFEATPTATLTNQFSF